MIFEFFFKEKYYTAVFKKRPIYAVQKYFFLVFLTMSQMIFAQEKGYVACDIIGQLANQLFQTAAAVCYALEHGYEARFPNLKDAINGDLNLKYVLHRLNTDPFPPDVEFIDYYEMGHNIYSPFPYEAGKNLRLHGYFASIKYFSPYSETIRELFAPKEEIVADIHRKYGDLLKKTSVAVHVRTFFPDGIDPNDGIGRSNWNYYLNAIKFFPDDCEFLIFSDSPEWVKEHFPKIRANIHFIEGNPHYFDFYFISLCDHQVISPKSTFALWAAWLNPNPEKMVLRADDGWLDHDHFPATWISINVN